MGASRSRWWAGKSICAFPRCPRSTEKVWSCACWIAPPAISTICGGWRSEEHTSELQSLRHLVCRLLLEKKQEVRGRTRDERTLAAGEEGGQCGGRWQQRAGVRCHTRQTHAPNPAAVLLILFF